MIMKLISMKSLKIFSIKIFSVIFSILLMIGSIPVKAEQGDLHHIKTTIYIKDIDTENNIIDGFKYKVIYEDGREQPVETIEEGVHEITLEIGDYVIVETSTVEGYIKSKDLHISLPFIEDDGIRTVKSIYPKHKKKEPTVNPDNPDNPEKPDNPDKPDKPDNPDKPDFPDYPDKPDNPDKPDYPHKPYKYNGKKGSTSISEIIKSKKNKPYDNTNISNLDKRDEEKIYDNKNEDILDKRENIDNGNSNNKDDNTNPADRNYSKTGNGNSLTAIIVLLSFNLMTLLIGFLIGSRIYFRKEEKEGNEKH